MEGMMPNKINVISIGPLGFNINPDNNLNKKVLYRVPNGDPYKFDGKDRLIKILSKFKDRYLSEESVKLLFNTPSKAFWIKDPSGSGEVYKRPGWMDEAKEKVYFDDGSSAYPLDMSVFKPAKEGWAFFWRKAKGPDITLFIDKPVNVIEDAYQAEAEDFGFTFRGCVKVIFGDYRKRAKDGRVFFSVNREENVCIHEKSTHVMLVAPANTNLKHYTDMVYHKWTVKGCFDTAIFPIESLYGGGSNEETKPQ
jgi:hypothetical protein